MRKLAVWLLVAGVVAFLGFEHWRSKNIGPVQRGFSVASRVGCFTCHGPGGGHGMADPGHGLGDVPTWSGGLISMYADNEGEIREWILDGIPKRVRSDPEQMAERKDAVILMPAWRGLLSDREVEDLVAYVKAVSDLESPKDQAAEDGKGVAGKFGCFNCHGPEGRGAMPDPRSFKGYIPSWDGADFPELARDDAEIREWIREGGTKRFRANPLARFFLEREAIKMPAYRDHITDAELDRLVDYIHWLRRRS
jgi:mono/diheme cytochrome c family protein